MGKGVNILVIEAYTDANIGSCALVENSINLLRQKYPNSQIRVMAHCAKAFSDLYDVDVVEDIFNYPFGRRRSLQLLWAMKTFFWMIMVWLQVVVFKKTFIFRNKTKDLAWADMVVSVGAERINDKFFKNILFSLYTYYIIKKMNKKMVIFPSTVGPFIFGWTRKLTSSVLKRVDMVYTRDEYSFYLTNDMPGIDQSKIVRTSDVAIFQKWSGPDEVYHMLKVPYESKLVGVSVMKWTYFKNKEETQFSNYEAYLSQMVSLVEKIITNFDVYVVLYPTNFPIHGCREDDLSVAKEVYAGMADKSKVRIIDSLYPPNVFKGLMACSEINVTTRMHACILSTGAYVPTISINYLFKLSEYMKALDLQEYSFDIEYFNAEETYEAFVKMWENKKYLRDHLEKKIAQMKDQLTNSMEKLDAVLAE